MTIRLKLSEIAEFFKYTEKVCPKTVIHGLEYDSRLIKGGELFVALKGEESHGNNFIVKALEQGAIAVLAEFEPKLDLDNAVIKENLDKIILVSDSLQAFQELAVYWSRKFSIPKIAVTGSMGKTFIKELTAALLMSTGNGCYSQKSFNNHVGVPYTLSKISPEHNWAVFELGMNHPGELSALSRLVKPDVALISCIAPVHMAFFKDLSEIAKAKLEILAGLSTEGTFIYNSDDEVLTKCISEMNFEYTLPKNVLSFGYSAESQVQILEAKIHELFSLKVKLRVFSEELELKLKVMGKHNAYNVAAAICAAKVVKPDLSSQHIEQVLSRFQPPPMRLNRYDLEDGRILVDDSYNSNPLALSALINFAGDLIAEKLSCGFIVGDMLELGEAARQHHRELAEKLAKIQPAFVISVGEFAEEFKEAAKKQGIPAYVAASPEAAAHTAEKLNSAIIFVKASRGVALDRAVQTLLRSVGEKIPALAAGDKQLEGAAGFNFKK